MKMRLLTTCVMCMLMSVVAFAQEKKVTEKDLLGEWEFKMEHPMGGTVDGVCTFKQESGQTFAFLSMSGEGDVKTSAIAHKEGNVFTATTDGEYPLFITFTLAESNKIACDLDAGVVLMGMDMTKKK